MGAGGPSSSSSLGSSSSSVGVPWGGVAASCTARGSGCGSGFWKRSSKSAKSSSSSSGAASACSTLSWAVGSSPRIGARGAMAAGAGAGIGAGGRDGTLGMGVMWRVSFSPSSQPSKRSSSSRSASPAEASTAGASDAAGGGRVGVSAPSRPWRSEAIRSAGISPMRVASSSSSKSIEKSSRSADPRRVASRFVKSAGSGGR